METRVWHAINENTYPLCVAVDHDKPWEAFSAMAAALFQRKDEFVGAVSCRHEDDGFYLEAYVLKEPW